MLDVLLIGPLGWEASVWQFVTEQFPTKRFAYLTYTDENLEQLASKTDFLNQLSDLQEQLTPETLIISASFGTVVLLSFLEENFISNPLILIDGFQQLPEKAAIPALFAERPEEFSDKQAYLNTVLDETDQENSQLVKIALDNLTEKLRVTTSNHNYVKALSAFSGVNPAEILQRLALDTSYVFSSVPIAGVKMTAITPESHLLMLTNPQQLLAVIGKKLAQ
ncbi:hypothetical protein [Enterococcus sp. HY326]|uniref:hypothetical protein n=1 Tax=Enterococcus sp. HY326 TaxID=2971265 RepID=UPI00223EF9C2|nr:hypothetical protein [Enterococcus sp. HY326]